jgi:hypothetical protein
MEEFFDHRWSNDKNQAITSDADRDLVEQLPIEIQRAIYTDFLFKGFLQNFRRYFSIPNYQNSNKHSYYTWANF